ncbi:hypothetical protein R1sor_015687 [Riccia sorocarpa]|uniref:DUF7869 domain-containing protein n=1 Tax=Riccia sorocarpa TaxID=122646 RepID=A0ABD3HDB2_9MARC
MRGDLAFSEDLQHLLLQALHNKPIFEKTFLNLKGRRVEDFLNLEIPISSQRPFTKLPPTFYIQLDNSGKDNKNWTVMAFLSELVTRGVFKTVIASFLIVGHTHEDVDAFFSKINRVLSGKHVSSISQLLAEVHGAEEKKSLPRFITEVADYKSHAKPYHQPFTGFRDPVAFKFTMMDNRPIYQYQLKYGDPWLPTFGNTVWKRRDPKSQVDFSVIPPPDREPVDVGMFEKHANAEDISSYLKAYIKHVKSIQEKTSPTSALLSMDQAIGDYRGKILKLLEKGWPSNKGAREQDLLGREAGEELEERERPFVGSVLERGMESFTPVLDIHPGHMVIIQPADDFVPKNVVWLARAVSIVNREANTTYHNHVKVNWYRPKHKVSSIDDRGRYQNCMRRTQEWEKDPHEYPENEIWGYFDHVAGILGAFQHPIILIEEVAMLWMGVRVCPEYNFDLLIKDSQLDDIIAKFLATGLYERVEQDIKYRLRDPYVMQVPRLRRIDQHPFRYVPLNLWSESIYMLPVTSPLVEVPAPMGLIINLVEDRFDLIPGGRSISYETVLARGLPIVPNKLALSAEFKVPVYIPSIPPFIDALLDKIRHPKTMGGSLPPYHLSNFIRYLHLEKPSQRQKLIPELAKRNREDMVIKLNKYKRKPKFDFRPWLKAVHVGDEVEGA